MRLEDWQKWLDAQFVEGEEAPSDSPEFEGDLRGEPVAHQNAALDQPEAVESEPLKQLASDEAPAEEYPDQRATLIEASVETFSIAVSARDESVQQTPAPAPQSAPSPPAPSPEFDMPVPAIEQYLPFLKSSQPASAEPSTQTQPEPAAQTASVQVEPSPAPQAQSTPRREPPPPARRFGPPSHRSKRSARERSDQASAPLTPEEMWSLAPRHLKALIAMTGEEVAQHSYRREFKESRIELIQRLLDPTISLEETARLLNVCPTTVRRYTNRGVLRHQRTVGDQRRFKLSDVLSFIESQSQVPTTRDR